MEDAIELDKAQRHAQPHSNMGMIYYVKGNTAKAHEQWELATRLGWD